MHIQSIRFFAGLFVVGLALSASSTNAAPVIRPGPDGDDLNLAQRATVSNNLSTMPLPFTKNMGQWPDSILFRVSANGATMWFTKNGIWYQFFRTGEKSMATERGRWGHPPRTEGPDGGFDSSPIGRNPLPRRVTEGNPGGSRAQREVSTSVLSEAEGSTGSPDMAPDSIETTMIKAEFVGASESVEVVGLEELEYKYNYFIGNNSSKWRTDVPNYSAVTMRGLYPGVDVTFSAEDGRLLERMYARSSNDLAQVKVEYRSGDGVIRQTANLLSAPFFDGYTGHRPRTTVQTSIGERHFKGVLLSDGHESKTEQQVALATSSVSGVTLTYSTFLGGGSGGGAYPRGIAVDSAGSAYVSGETTSSDFPTVIPFDGSLNGTYDAFVTKLSPAGNSLVYSTYLGGSGNDEDAVIAVDALGSVYVTGFTGSSDYPTATPFDATLNVNGTYNFASDAFVTKLSPAGNSLVYSTYLGGSLSDLGSSIAVDSAGSAYVTGETRSSDFPTVIPFDGSLNGTYDAFVTKLSPAGNSLVYSTYLGGSGQDGGNGIALDETGNTFVTGNTYTPDFPTVNPFNGSWSGNSDAFVTKLSPAGNSLVYSTYLGGNGQDGGNGIAVDREGSAYVTGRTVSSDFPTANPLDGIYNGGDAFVTKLSPAGNSLVYSTYLGGSSEDFCRGIAVDDAGSAYVTGRTWSSDFPTVTPFDSTLNYLDAFVTKLSQAGNSLVYSAYLGGSGYEEGWSIAVDRARSVYVTGDTYSSDFPTANPFDGIYNGGEAFVTKLGPSSCCIGVTGNVDCDSQQGIDISDLSRLIDYLYISLLPLCCVEEGNVDGDPGMGIDISDLSRLIDYLYISFTPPAVCQ